MHYLGDKQLQKKECGHFEQHTSIRKSSVTLIRTAAWWFTQVLHNLVNLSDIFGVETKLKESILKNSNQINQPQQPEHRFCPQNGLEHSQVQDWYPNFKSGCGPRLFKQLVLLFFRMYGYCIVLIKMKAMSLYLFWFFEEMFSVQFL